jgi:hypothetical protein
MSSVHEVGVDDYLADLMERVLRASPGPFLVVPGPAGRHAVARARGGAVIASFRRAGDAELFARALVDLRMLATSISEVLGLHHDGGAGWCEKCGERAPCATRELLLRALDGPADRPAADP